VKRLLLDTHAWLWWLADDAALGARARECIAADENVIYVSAASIWEIAIKKGLGKLEAPDGMDAIIEEEGFDSLPIELFHAEQVGTLPALHRDPFDRMLVAQAQAEGLAIITSDPVIPGYGIRTIDAGR
jgi:PIN domain nuclease of toxin-antitoxin system